MKIRQIASSGTHAQIVAVPERPDMLQYVGSQLRVTFGHGVAWKSGAAYVTLRNGDMVAVPKHCLAKTVKQYGEFILSIR